MGPLRLILLGALVAVGTVLALETVRKRRLSSLVSGSQFWIRVAAAIVLMVEIAMILAGTYLLPGTDPLLQILYWTGCLILAFLLIVLTILDVRGVLINYLIERRSILRGTLPERKDD